MLSDRDDPLTVEAESVGKAPKLWAWAIYRGADRFLIIRSRAAYHDRASALDAGLKAAMDVGRRLGTKVVIADADKLVVIANEPSFTRRRQAS